MRRAFARPGNTRSLVASLSSRRAKTDGQFKQSQPQLQSQWQYGPNSDLFARDETKTIMSIERQSKLWSGPPIIPADPAVERDQLIAANQAFATALKRALRSGAETSAGVLATVSVLPKIRCRRAGSIS
jgi:hypothetical protein